MATRSDEFVVGQMVVFNVAVLDQYITTYQKKVSNRIGIVRTVCPAENPDPGRYCGHVNVVFVEWQKKRGRGKVSHDMMRPRQILPAKDEQIKEWL